MAENNDFTHLPLPLLFQGNRNCVVAAQHLLRQREILLIGLLMVAM